MSGPNLGYKPGIDYSNMGRGMNNDSSGNKALMDTAFGGPGKSSNYAGWIGAGAGALGLAGSMFGLLGNHKSKSDFDYDPSRRALGRYNDLTNYGSDYWKNAISIMTRNAANAQPTLATMSGFGRMNGLSPESAFAIGSQQVKAESGRARESVLDSSQKMMMGSEQIAQGYLGQEYDRAKTEMSLFDEYESGRSDNSLNFFDQLLGSGASMLTRFGFPF